MRGVFLLQVTPRRRPACAASRGRRQWRGGHTSRPAPRPRQGRQCPTLPPSPHPPARLPSLRISPGQTTLTSPGHPWVVVAFHIMTSRPKLQPLRAYHFVTSPPRHQSVVRSQHLSLTSPSRPQPVRTLHFLTLPARQPIRVYHTLPLEGLLQDPT